MSDPSTANSRVFVGNIPTNEMTKKDLEEKFKKYGPILGMLRCNMTFTYWIVKHTSSIVVGLLICCV
jgi:RNA recognition motif-containing protein